ncbi:MAG: oxidoreductase domain protein [Chitinophagaceae bacterium]|nr:oxidoreductase domain protein [Chitinophagaceae bacterium]
MPKLLIIGCGNIGAQYDWDTSDIHTHAKAFAALKTFELFFTDRDRELANKVADRYNGTSIPDLTQSDLQIFDIVSICTPTSSHFGLLERAMKENVKVIICEKPVSDNIENLEKLGQQYQHTQSKVMVNYFRRFLPGYTKLRDLVQSIGENDAFTNISIRYQRGYINNCSHALDLLGFLTGEKFVLNAFKTNAAVFDQFETDPTLTAHGFWKDVSVSITGLQNVLYAHFEMDLYFKQYKIAIRDAGNTVNVYKAGITNRFLSPLSFQEKESQTNLMNNYMMPIAEHAVALLHKKIPADNFEASIALNISMIRNLNTV